MPAAFSSSSVLPTRRDLGARVDDVRDDVVVHVPRLAGEDFGNRDALVLRLVRQHRPGDDVADGVDCRPRSSGNARRRARASAVVERDAGLRQSEPVGVGHAADGDEHDVGFERLGLAAFGRLDACSVHAVPSRLRRRDLARRA